MIRYSVHAERDQMPRRRISKAEVEQVLASPEITYLSEEGRDRTVILGTTSASRRLKVVVRTDDPQFVVTVADRDDSL
jgi:hypothetical protein